MEEMLKEFLIALIQKAPWGVAFLLSVATLRGVFKPLMTFLHAYVDVTPTTKDNQMLEKAEASRAYKALVFIVDWLASIKLPEKKQ